MKIHRVWACALIQDHIYTGNSQMDQVSVVACWTLPCKGLAYASRPVLCQGNVLQPPERKAKAEKLTFWKYYRIYTDSILYHHYIDQGKEFHAVVLAKHNMAKSCYVKRKACQQLWRTIGETLSTEASFMQGMKAWQELWNSAGWRGT